MADQTEISWCDKTFNPLEHGGKLIPGYPAYAITRDGNVWTRWNRGGRGPRTITSNWRRKSPFRSRAGYLRVELYGGEQPKHELVHRLVLLCFVGPCPHGMQGCHNNGIVNDNRVENLRWDTAKNNASDKGIHGTISVGSRQPQAKLTEDGVRRIRAMRRNGILLREIAEVFGVSIAKVGQVTTGKNWKHVNG